MNRFFRSFFTLLFVLAFCCNINATERFVVIADAEVPDLMKTVQSVGAFSDKIMPGSSIMLVGGVIALNFNPQFAPFNITSNLQLVAYGDTVDKASLPLLCAVAAKNSNNPLPETIKVRKNKLFVKQLQGKAVVSSSDLLLQKMTAVHEAGKTESDLIVNFFPDKYLKQCPGNIAYLRSKFDKEISGQYGNIPDNKSVEKLLQQCQKMQIKVDAGKSTIDLKMIVNPVKTSELAKFLTARPPGSIASGDIVKLAKKISGSQSFNLTNGLNGVLTLILTKIFPKGDSDIFAKLCDIKVSHDKTALFFSVSVSQDALLKTLISAGIVKPQTQKGI